MKNILKNHCLQKYFSINSKKITVESLEKMYKKGTQLIENYYSKKSIKPLESIEIFNSKSIDALSNAILNNEKLRKRIETLGEMNYDTVQQYKGGFNDFICSILISIYGNIYQFYYLFYYLLEDMIERPWPILWIVASVIFPIYSFIGHLTLIYPLATLLTIFDCWPTGYPLEFENGIIINNIN